MVGTESAAAFSPLAARGALRRGILPQQTETEREILKYLKQRGPWAPRGFNLRRGSLGFRAYCSRQSGVLGMFA